MTFGGANKKSSFFKSIGKGLKKGLKTAVNLAADLSLPGVPKEVQSVAKVFQPMVNKWAGAERRDDPMAFLRPSLGSSRRFTPY